MQLVAGAHRNDMGLERFPEQYEIAEQIENLVTYELVRETQGIVQNTGFTENDGVIERAA